MGKYKTMPIAGLSIEQAEGLLLKFFSHNCNTQQEASEIMNKDQICELTGYSMDTLNKMIQRNEIPYYKSKGRKKIFFKRSEIIDWVFSNRIETQEEYLNRKDAEFVNNRERKVS